MNISDIIDYVVGQVQDGSFTEGFILGLVNEARYLVASSVDLPNLRKSSTVTTTATDDSVAMPSDYHKKLHWVGSTVQGKRIGEREGDYYNAMTFHEVFPITQGPIEAVCVEGSRLLYRGKADDTLVLRYYAAPVDAVSMATEPSEIPSHFQRKILSAYCLREIHADIEDGMEGQKVNTSYWDAMFKKYMADLAEFLHLETPRAPKHIRASE